MVRSLRGEVAMVVMMNLVQWMLYQIRNIRQSSSPVSTEASELYLKCLPQSAACGGCTSVRMPFVPAGKSKFGHNHLGPNLGVSEIVKGAISCNRRFRIEARRSSRLCYWRFSRPRAQPVAAII